MPFNKIQKGIYKSVSHQKASGVTYTPSILADFVATEILQALPASVFAKRTINLFDPAVGNGQLLDRLLLQIPDRQSKNIQIDGYEIDKTVQRSVVQNLSVKYPDVNINIKHGDFLANIPDSKKTLCQDNKFSKYDAIIANPPYVRTQILGAEQSQQLAKRFNLTGRVDLCFAFLAGLSELLESDGVMGIIVSNRFMTTKAGTSVRKMILEKYHLLKIWDFGDTKLFDAAVLPAVLLATKRQKKLALPSFSSIYETQATPESQADNPVDAVLLNGNVEVNDGRVFYVQHGTLGCSPSNDDVWRIETQENSDWLNTVKLHTKLTFSDIGKIRVGVKTTADKIFIRSDWDKITEGKRPELLKPLTTHHIARQFRAASAHNPLQILYPHEVVNGKRFASELSAYPNTRRYLLKNKQELESRDYVIEAGRQWYEIWVPQDPAAWKTLKLVFRDISEKPTFWIDTSGSVINGDCYWLTSDSGNIDLIWLAAAVANSAFIEAYYDCCFCNKLYSGRRRFMTQYVEKFPLPDPAAKISKKIISLAKTIYRQIDNTETDVMKQQLDDMVWQSFGLVKKVNR